MTLLILPVRPGDHNPELRYALRSWEENLLLPNLELMTVGYCPIWLKPEIHIPGNYFRSTYLAVFDNIKRASDYAAHLGYTSALYMNDDFFCVKPTTVLKPVRRNMTLDEHRAMFPSKTGSPWVSSLDLTASWLAEAGFPHPDSYEVHRPLLASPRDMSGALGKFGNGFTHGVPQWRTIYGTLMGIEADPVEDVKLPLAEGTDCEWVSTSDEAWRRYARTISGRFQKPSHWEL